MNDHTAAARLRNVARLWGLTDLETAKLFGVDADELQRWLKEGVPETHDQALALLASATAELDARIKRERIPTVVRRPASGLGGSSILDVAHEGRHRDVRDAVLDMFNLRRVEGETTEASHMGERTGQRQPTSQDPAVHSGDVVFAGTRVPVEALWDYLRGGGSISDFRAGFPTVGLWQIDAVLDERISDVPEEIADWCWRAIRSNDSKKIRVAIEQMERTAGRE